VVLHVAAAARAIVRVIEQRGYLHVAAYVASKGERELMQFGGLGIKSFRLEREGSSSYAAARSASKLGY